MKSSYYQSILHQIQAQEKMLAVLLDPEKFNLHKTQSFLNGLPSETTHLFVGGSTVFNGETETVVTALKKYSKLPVFLFPGDHSHITHRADVLLFLSLLSGRNAEYLVGQQVKSINRLKESPLEIIPTGYLLIDGGNNSSVSKVTGTEPLPQENIEFIVHTALAGKFMGAKLIYLEAGSGAPLPVDAKIIAAVKEAIQIPLIVGGGIRTTEQRQTAYRAGADMVVMGTAYEKLQ